MDRETLAAQLAEGRSIESIARELRPRGVDRRVLGQQVRPRVSHAPAPRTPRRDRARAAGGARRGGPVDPRRSRSGLDVVVHDRPALAAALRARRRRVRVGSRETAPARAAGAETTEAHCPVHGLTTFVRRGSDGFRCRLCRTSAVHRRRREIKRLLVEEAGGAACSAATTRRSPALHFHHLDPARKRSRCRAGRDPFARRGARGGAQMRAAVLELPCRSRGRDCATAAVATTMRAAAALSSAFGGSSIGRAFGC